MIENIKVSTIFNTLQKPNPLICIKLKSILVKITLTILFFELFNNPFKIIPLKRSSSTIGLNKIKLKTKLISLINKKFNSLELSQNNLLKKYPKRL